MLQNHIVMCPLTRNRAINNVPNELMAQYYAQRASVGLIITEGTSPSPNGLGYPRIPGIFSQDQIDGWKPVVEAVHAGGAKFFLQLMHCGRIVHEFNLPKGATALAPSAVAAAGEMHTDVAGPQPFPTPRAMSEIDIKIAIGEYAQAAKNAISAGFDGVELHAANGYLLEQFFRPTSNRRTDGYGGSVEKRARFVLETVEASIRSIGKEKVGIRLSPFGVLNDMRDYPEQEADYEYLARELDAREVLYVHLVDHSAMGAPVVPLQIKQKFRELFKGTLILSGGYDAVRAEKDVAEGRADLIAVGRPILANPDLVHRWRVGAKLNVPDMETLYTPGPKGYVDYPFL